MNQILIELMPLLLKAVEVVAYAAITAAAGFAARKWNVDIGESRMKALHSALMTGARSALSRRLTGMTAVEFVEAYARESVPDAFAALRPSPKVIQNLARAKLAEAHDPLSEALAKAVRE